MSTPAPLPPRRRLARRVAGTNGITLYPGNIPVVRSGAWHTIPPYGPVGSVTMPQNRAFALPFWPGHRCVLAGVAVDVTVIAAGGDLRFGLYSCANALPCRLISELGTVAAGGIGIQQLTGLTQHVRAVLMFLVVVRQGGLVNFGLSTRDTWSPMVSGATPVLDSNLNAYYQDGVTGALPAQFGIPAGSSQGPGASIQLV